MYQSSGVASLTIRSTPTWKSSELVEVEAARLDATFTSGSPPCEAQSPTVLPLNYSYEASATDQQGENGTFTLTSIS